MKLNRNQLSQVFKNHETLRAFEQALEAVSDTIPGTTAEAQAIATGAAERAANIGGDVDRLSAMVRSLEILAYSSRDESAIIRRLEHRIEELEIIVQQRGASSAIKQLLSRIDGLESQLIALSRTVNIDDLQKQINELQYLVKAN